MDSKLSSSSHIARHGIQECNYCLKSRTDAGKLFACSGCKLAMYCSARCQKFDWRFHKQVCQSIQEERSHLKDVDKLSLMSALSKRKTMQEVISSGAVLPSVIMNEFCTFAEKYKLPLMEAAYNALRVTTDPSLSERAVLSVLLERAPERAQSPRMWARVRVAHAKPMTQDELVAAYGRAHMPPFMTQLAKLRDIHSRASDYVMSLTVILSTFCSVMDPPIPMHFPVPIEVTPAYMRAVALTDEWEQRLKDIVEKISSRKSSARG